MIRYRQKRKVRRCRWGRHLYQVQKQSAGTIHGVAGYVSQKQKTVQEDGQQLVSGQSCTP